ncbi:DUF4403 family protein [Sphingomonas sp. MMS12-HWE2-04]|uniref:DUF4403 family protein n=1 Tax=Sphingomonas sp. MMS12-HWE2-04 TaxID=3234199 RepID=UPI00384F05CF
MKTRSATRLLSALCLGGLASACSGGGEVKPPPRAKDAVPKPSQSSVLAVPIDLDTEVVRRAVENAIPRQLWTIEQHSSRCVKPRQVKLFGAKLKVTPPISCTIEGVVTRGAIRLRGQGRDIIADMPINARISARDIGGLLKGETATGSAMAHARIQLDLGADWNPRGRVKLGYDWLKTPGIDFLGQRITFTEKADAKLAPVLRKLEAELPRELARANLRGQVERLWRQAFTTIELNAEKPPVWMRLTPQKLRYGGYEMHGQRLQLNLGLDAITETFVGPRPTDPAPSPLPALERAQGVDRLRFFIPVVADYGELEPVILRALNKRAKRPFDVPGIGAVRARFEKIVAYGTSGGKIAVGVTLAAKPEALNVGETHGLIWLVARPINAPDSPRVAFDQLSVTGDTDGIGGDLLIKLVSSPALSGEIAGSLTQNFANDLSKLLDKIKRAIERKQAGDFTISAKIEKVQTGRIAAYGQALYLPVNVEGSAAIAYRPQR